MNNRAQRVNEQINISPIRLINANGEQLGITSTSQALKLARESGMDLVEIAPNERPPVCKILDFGKLCYDKSRKVKKQHQQKTKEIRISPRTQSHDVETKINQARRFLDNKDKVLLNVVFRGREMQHVEEGRHIIETIVNSLTDIAKVEKIPSMEGRRMTAILSPLEKLPKC